MININTYFENCVISTENTDTSPKSLLDQAVISGSDFAKSRKLLRFSCISFVLVREGCHRKSHGSCVVQEAAGVQGSNHDLIRLEDFPNPLRLFTLFKCATKTSIRSSSLFSVALLTSFAFVLFRAGGGVVLPLPNTPSCIKMVVRSTSRKAAAMAPQKHGYEFGGP